MSQNLTCYSENGNSSCANLLRPAIFCEWRYFVSRKIQAHFSAIPSLACFVNNTGTLPCFTVARLLRALHWQLLGTANLDISILIYLSIRVRFHFTTAYMWFHQDAVVLRLTVVRGVCELAERPGTALRQEDDEHRARSGVRGRSRVR